MITIMIILWCLMSWHDADSDYHVKSDELRDIQREIESERRHRELMDMYRAESNIAKTRKKRTTRRIAKSPDGWQYGEEVTEELV